jgi:integrase
VPRAHQNSPWPTGGPRDGGRDHGPRARPSAPAGAQRRRRRWVVGRRKTIAGHRRTLPAAVAAVLGGHLETHVHRSPDALLFATRTGGYLARSNWNSTFRRAADAIGLPAVRPHELRHTGGTLAAATGATTKELMRRLGHSSPAAALLYQHAADDRDAEIARALDAMLRDATASSDDHPDQPD